MISLLKYCVAKLWMRHMLNKLHKEGVKSMTESLNQRWIHLQGQILTGGRMKWRWDKLFMKNE